MSESSRTIHLCGHPLHGRQHVCAFFDSRDEEYGILNPFFQEGLACGEEVVTIVESPMREEHLARMAASGIDIDRAVQSEQLKVLASEATYLTDGVFVAERMIEMLRGLLEEASTGRYGCVRAMGDMEWALRNLPVTDELLVYEARVNQLIDQHDCTLLCAYDVTRFSGRLIADVLATHSHVIINGDVQENPYYLDPVVYLKKLALRKAAESIMREVH